MFLVRSVESNTHLFLSLSLFLCNSLLLSPCPPLFLSTSPPHTSLFTLNSPAEVRSSCALTLHWRTPRQSDRVESSERTATVRDPLLSGKISEGTEKLLEIKIRNKNYALKAQKRNNCKELRLCARRWPWRILRTAGNQRFRILNKQTTTTTTKHGLNCPFSQLPEKSWNGSPSQKIWRGLPSGQHKPGIHFSRSGQEETAALRGQERPL